MTLNSLMQKLRAKSSRHKTSSIEAIKIVHNISHDKKNGETVSFEKQLELIRDSIKISKRSYTLDKLESIASRFEGVKFGWNEPHEEAVLMNDYFSIKIKVGNSGVIDDCFVALNMDTKKCPELLKHLKNFNFHELENHIQGLLNLDRISADKKIRQKVLMSLLALEVDILSISRLQMQNIISNVQKYAHTTPLGIVVARSGGLPLKLIFFIRPYDIMVLEKQFQNVQIENVIEKKVGQMISISIEQSASNNRLQIMPIMLSYRMSDGKSLPTFSGLVNSNSAMLPAHFVVVLPQPMPIFCTRLQLLPGYEVNKTNAKSLSLLLYEEIFNPEMVWNRCTNYALHDQFHKYFIFDNTINHVDESRNYHNLVGSIVSRIHFTHPTHLPTIIGQLRLQAFFNTILGSCFKKNEKTNNLVNKEEKIELAFDITILSMFQIVINFQHPRVLRLITVDLELTDQLAVNCKLSYGITQDSSIPLPSNEYANKVMQRCLSIPILLRSIIKKLNEMPYNNLDIYGGTNLKFVLPPPTLPKHKKICLALMDSKSPATTTSSSSKESSDSTTIHARLIYNLVHFPPHTEAPLTIPTPTVVPITSRQAVPVELQPRNLDNIKIEACVDVKPELRNFEMMLINHKMGVFNRQETYKQDKVLSNPMLASLLDQPASSQPVTPITNQSNSSVISRLPNSPLQPRKRGVQDWGMPPNMVRPGKQARTGYLQYNDPSFNPATPLYPQSDQSLMMGQRVAFTGATDLRGQRPLTPISSRMPQFFETEYDRMSPRCKPPFARQLSEGSRLMGMGPGPGYNIGQNYDVSQMGQIGPGIHRPSIQPNQQPIGQGHGQAAQSQLLRSHLMGLASPTTDPSRLPLLVYPTISKANEEEATPQNPPPPPIKVKLDKRAFATSMKDGDAKATYLSDLLTDVSPNSTPRSGYQDPDAEVDRLTSLSNLSGSQTSSRPNSATSTSSKRTADVFITDSSLPQIPIAKKPKMSKNFDKDSRKLDRKKESVEAGSTGNKKKTVSKKQEHKIYEFRDEDEAMSPSPVTSLTPHNSATKISKIKITNSGGKLRIQNPANSSVGVGSSVPKINKHAGKFLVGHMGIGVGVGGVKMALNVKSAGLAASNNKSDSKLARPAQVKLKQLPTTFATVTAGSPTNTPTQNINSGNSVATKVTQSMTSTLMQGSTNIKTKSPSLNTSSEISKNKIANKGSINSVIDNLLLKKNATSSNTNTAGSSESQKELYDAIRLEIIKEGNKPSGGSTKTGVSVVKKSEGQSVKIKEGNQTQKQFHKTFPRPPPPDVRMAATLTPPPFTSYVRKPNILQNKQLSRSSSAIIDVGRQQNNSSNSNNNAINRLSDSRHFLDFVAQQDIQTASPKIQTLDSSSPPRSPSPSSLSSTSIPAKIIPSTNLETIEDLNVVNIIDKHTDMGNSQKHIDPSISQKQIDISNMQKKSNESDKNLEKSLDSGLLKEKSLNAGKIQMLEKPVEVGNTQDAQLNIEISGGDEDEDLLIIDCHGPKIVDYSQPMDFSKVYSRSRTPTTLNFQPLDLSCTLTTTPTTPKNTASFQKRQLGGNVNKKQEDEGCTIDLMDEALIM